MRFYFHKRRISSRKLIFIVLIAIVFYVGYSMFLKFNNLTSTKLIEREILNEDMKFPADKVMVFDKPQQTCAVPQDNFVFIKCMKCGTETMGSIIRRYGFVRNLSFVLPVDKRLYLGWPFQMFNYDYRPSNHGFNILMEHAIYNKTTMNKLMPANTKYITMIREPFSHFVSTFYYFKVDKITNMTSRNPINEYLRNIDKYESIYKSSQAAKFRYCIPDGFSVTKNLLSHCLGLPLGFPRGQLDYTADDLVVNQYISQLNDDFTLVMIMDYFDESLVLLKRLFCWSFKDILYMQQNNGDYGGKKSRNLLQTFENHHLHQAHDSIDYKLFNYFNKTFWKKVEKSPDFYEELQSYRQINSAVITFCSNNANSTKNEYHVRNNKFTRDFFLYATECDLIQKYLLLKLKYFYDKHSNQTNLEAKQHKTQALC